MSTDQFRAFADALSARYSLMLTQGPVFVVSAADGGLWTNYLASFPEGTNPIYRVNTEHDGSYDRNFVRRVGGCVSINDKGELLTIWSVPGLPYPYNVVAESMDNFVKDHVVDGLWATRDSMIGCESNVEHLENGSTKRWYHFNAKTPAKYLAKGSVGEVRGAAQARFDVACRGVHELTPEAVEVALDLCREKSVYRHEEWKPTLEKFAFMQHKLLDMNLLERNNLLWQLTAQTGTANHNYLLVRNTALGTLLIDLCDEDMDVEAAVKKFEATVAPSNYKRPKAIVTAKQLQQAQDTLSELGLDGALSRRLATLEDLNIKDVIWVSNKASDVMKGQLSDLLARDVAKPMPKGEAKDISIDAFLKDVLPHATGIDLCLQNKHQTNLVTLTTAVDPTYEPIFKWGNHFAWSYNGDVADSDMRELVKQRGGSVTGVFRFTHSWNHPGKRNGSLMDLHVFMPGHNGARGDRGSGHSGYGNSERVGWNHRTHPRSGGVQDVDYTAIAPVNFIPVENITFPRLDKMPEGTYKCSIQNWSYRSPTEGGFMAQIEFAGQIFDYDYRPQLKNNEWVDVAEVTLKNGEFTIKHLLPHGSSSLDVWGVKTEEYLPVTTLLNSPNYWDDKTQGNKHWFFILEGCHTTEPVRGIYNEFLRDELAQHRRVFELLGQKAKCPTADKQLSGVGFSSTQQASVKVRVRGPKTNALYNINFGT